MTNNDIMIINAYRYSGGWVFDDDEFGLKREAFIMGASQLIDRAIDASGYLSEKAHGAKLIFSHHEFPGAHLHVEFSHTDFGGAWYIDPVSKMAGWLCPATLHYFPDFPYHIYLRIDSVQNKTVLSKMKSGLLTVAKKPYYQIRRIIVRRQMKKKLESVRLEQK